MQYAVESRFMILFYLHRNIPRLDAMLFRFSGQFPGQSVLSFLTTQSNINPCGYAASHGVFRLLKDICPLAPGKLQQPQRVNSDLHQRYCWHKSELIHAGGTGPGRCLDSVCTVAAEPPDWSTGQICI